MSPPKSGRRRKGRSPNGRSSSRAIQDPVILLMVLARALNHCEKAGINPQLKHGIIFTDAGYVLDLKGKWVARPLKGGTW